MAQISFDDAIIRYRDRILRYLETKYSIDNFYVEDVTQNVFIELNRKWDTLEHEESMICSWLYEAARYKAKEHYRELKKHEFTYSLEEHLTPDTYSTNIDSLLYFDTSPDNDECEEYLERLKPFLTSMELTVVKCLYENDYDLEKTAKALDISQENLRVRIFRIRQKARKNKAEILKK